MGPYAYNSMGYGGYPYSPYGAGYGNYGYGPAIPGYYYPNTPDEQARGRYFHQLETAKGRSKFGILGAVMGAVGGGLIAKTLSRGHASTTLIGGLMGGALGFMLGKNVGGLTSGINATERDAGDNGRIDGSIFSVQA
ncbi:MAG: hypothetical protein AB7P76_07175 [Candidatus Melainabacteria bacterium]